MINMLYIWIIVAFTLLAIDVVFAIFLIVVLKKTHASIELKAWVRRKPIALFFQENRYCEWKPVSTFDGIVQDAKYGAYIINQRATYVDKTTKNILLPFDASFDPEIKVPTEDLIKDFSYMVKDEEEMKSLRKAIADSVITMTDSLKAMTSTIHIGALKNMTKSLVPHNVSQKIEKLITERMKSFGAPKVKELLILFGATFGIIILGAILMKTIGGA